MRLYLPLLAFMLTCTAVAAFSQTAPVKGKVTDENGKPLSNVVVSVKNGKIMAITKDDGSYALNARSKNDTLIITFTGYSKAEIGLNGRSVVDVSLTPSSTNLQDVIVVSAMGVNKTAASVTYASQTINPDNLTEARDVNFLNTLNGKVAGLQVTGTGQPGGSARLTLRGDNSLTGNNQPLFVVDGVPIANSQGDGGKGAENGSGFLDYGNGAADINPDDIESITVLKGPNAAALYGSKASNGAILITTKKGKPGGDNTLGLSLNQNVMFYTITQFPEYQNVYGEGANARLVTNPATLIVPGTGAVNMGSSAQSWGMPMLGQPINNFAGQPIPGGYVPQPNNVRDLYQNSATSTTNASIGKSDAISAFRVSYTFTKGNDAIDNINLKKKHNLNLTGSRKFGKRVTIDARLAYTYDDTKNRMTKNLDPGNPLASYVYLTRSTPISAFTPYKDANGNSIALGQITDTENPYWSIYANSNEDAHSRIIGGVTATVELAKDLRFRGQVVTDMNYGDLYVYKELGSKKTPLGSYNNQMQRDQNWYYEGILTYNKKLSSNFNLNLLAGASLQDNNSLIRGAAISALLVHEMPSISNANTTPTAFESLVRTKQQSVYGSATIGYQDFLYLDATARNEWSSTLPMNNNSFFYPSVGMSFIFSRFIRPNKILTSGKLRVNYAKVGGSTQAYQLLNTYQSGGIFLGNPYLSYTQDLKNANIKPEQTTSREIGLDISLFKSRLNLTGTYYSNNTINQIIRATTAYETGFNSRIVNAGEIQNKGLELTANYTAMQTKKVKWTVFANYAHNKNLVVSLLPGVNRLVLGGNLGATVSATVGQPFGLITGTAPYKVGDTILVGTNGRNIADPNVIAGIGRPKFTGALGTSVKVGRFDFQVTATIRWGGSLYSASYGRAMFAGTTVKSLDGRDEWLFSNFILNENPSERQNIGQTVGTTVTRYWDSLRVKGLAYPNAYLAKTDPVTGALVYDKNGRLMVGSKSVGWVYPQLVNGNDKVTNDVPYLTFDASSIKISEVIIGYTVDPQLLRRTFVKGARLAFVGRNLWQIFQKTPLGIDPESASSSQNGSLGIEAGGSFPYASWGFDLKVSF